MFQHIQQDQAVRKVSKITELFVDQYVTAFSVGGSLLRSSMKEVRADIQLLLECIKCQLDNPTAVKQSLVTIASMCSDSEGARSYLRECGGLTFILKLLTTNLTSEAKEVILYTLGCAVDKSVYSQEEICISTVFSFLRDVLSGDSSLKYRRTAVFLISSLVANNSQGQMMVRTSGCLQQLFSQFRSCLPDMTIAKGESWFDNLEGSSFQLWCGITTALGSCVNNPQNDENQRLCANIFPQCFKLMQDNIMEPRIVKPIASLIGLAVASNLHNKERVQKCGGLEVLVSGLHRAINRENQDENLQLAVVLTNTIDTVITDHAKNADKCGELGIIALLLALLQLHQLEPTIKIQVIITLGHCLDFSPLNQMRCVEEDGLGVLIQLLTEATDDELNKAIKYVLHSCVNTEAGIMTNNPVQSVEEPNSIISKRSLSKSERALHILSSRQKETNLQSKIKRKVEELENMLGKDEIVEKGGQIDIIKQNKQDVRNRKKGLNAKPKNTKTPTADLSERGKLQKELEEERCLRKKLESEVLEVKKTALLNKQQIQVQMNAKSLVEEVERQHQEMHGSICTNKGSEKKDNDLTCQENAEEGSEDLSEEEDEKTEDYCTCEKTNQQNAKEERIVKEKKLQTSEKLSSNMLSNQLLRTNQKNFIRSSNTRLVGTRNKTSRIFLTPQLSKSVGVQTPDFHENTLQTKTPISKYRSMDPQTYDTDCQSVVKRAFKTPIATHPAEKDGVFLKPGPIIGRHLLPPSSAPAHAYTTQKRSLFFDNNHVYASAKYQPVVALKPFISYKGPKSNAQKDMNEVVPPSPVRSEFDCELLRKAKHDRRPHRPSPYAKTTNAFVHLTKRNSGNAGVAFSQKQPDRTVFVHVPTFYSRNSKPDSRTGGSLVDITSRNSPPQRVGLENESNNTSDYDNPSRIVESVDESLYSQSSVSTETFHHNNRIGSSRCPGCQPSDVVGYPLLNSRTYNIALETSSYTCNKHRDIRQIERRHIAMVKKQRPTRSHTRLGNGKQYTPLPLNRINEESSTASVYDIPRSSSTDSGKSVTPLYMPTDNDDVASVTTERSGSCRRPRVPYTKQEETNLLRGVSKIGKFWTQILNTYEFHHKRTAVDLKDKYKRLMVKMKEEEGEETTPRSRLGNHLEENCRASRHFSMVEERRLRRGVTRCGYNWKAILQGFRFAKGRTTEELREKWRCLHKPKYRV